MNGLQAGIQPEARMTSGRKTAILGIWVFPYVLAACAYFAGVFYEPALVLRTSVLTWPIPQAVYGWFFSVTGRETVVSALQWDAVVSALTAIVFTGWGGWFIGTETLEWWFIVPWVAAIVDALTAAWLSINNAAQKPFMGSRGTT
jgi:hypothetical protein